MKLAIVTGGSKGLGKSLVDYYLKKGWVVYEFSRSGCGDNSVHCDFSDRAQACAVVDKLFATLAAQSWESIVVFNNVATIEPIGPLHKSQVNDWYASIDVNISSWALVTGLFIQYFQHHCGEKTVVSVSAGAARKAYFGWSLYCAAKSALESFSQCIALEQSTQQYPVKSLLINPGIIDTELQARIRRESKDVFAELERYRACSSHGHLACPDSIARKVYRIVDSEHIGGESYRLTQGEH